MRESSTGAGPRLTCDDARIGVHSAAACVTCSPGATLDGDESLRRAIRGAAAWMADPRVLIGLMRRLLAGRPDEAARLVENVLRQHGVPDDHIISFGWLGRPRTVLGLARRAALAGRQAAQGYIVIELERSVGPVSASTVIASLALRAAAAEGDGAAPPADSCAAAGDAATCEELRATVDELAMRLVAMQARFAALEEAKLADEKALLEADLTIVRLRGATRCEG
ncbi:hypothetical protein [Chelatococcus reniformis]|uniref:Uncharacterized protein n=1 Tax=Chelatococcus reniformis TaxID=1494448 RepID=A0A916UHR8_9HYPH|nr:hypothetical protein [Chelatococcus reniformis]GGC73471.1 hypothetical protein GCM10010994_34840 [Chelatococcus reniformis]